MAKKDYSNWSKEELVRELKKIEKRKKYGIVWEDKPEQVALLCKEKLPILAEDKSKEIVTDKEKSNHILIEGDNYHALSVLNYTHKGKIDVIYIDPPYNTGNNTWKYNNNYIERDDPFKHSKWLSFIFKRLTLAKNLLKPNGIIIVAIDDYEIFPLGLLMDEIFGESNRLATITVLNKKSGRTTDKFFATCHEYYLVYAKNVNNAKIGEFTVDQSSLESYKYQDEISRYKWRDFLRTGGYSTPEERPNSYYSIYYNAKTGKISVEKIKDSIEIWPIDSKGKKRVWRQTRPSLMRLVDQGDIKIEKTKQGKFTVRIKDRIKTIMKPKTVWDDPKYDAATHGTKLLEKILGQARTFEFPKSLYAVKDAIKIATDNPRAIILDFFAGSGTTAHAVLELNKDDKGNRKFILCTNNENNNGNGSGGIMEEVCYPRVKKVIQNLEKESKGKLVKNMPGNLKYFKTDFVDAEPTDRNKKKMVDKSTEMLCLKEDCFDEAIKGQDFKIFTNSQSKNLGIIYDDDGIEPFKKEIKKLKKKFVVYVFSLDESAREEEFEDVAEWVELKPIPAVILNVYKRIFK